MSVAKWHLYDFKSSNLFDAMEYKVNHFESTCPNFFLKDEIRTLFFLLSTKEG